MQDLSQKVFNRIETSGIISGVNIQHVNRVLESLDTTERSPTEIARLAGVPSAMGRIILQEAQKVDSARISNNHMRFRLSESIGDESKGQSAQSTKDKQKEEPKAADKKTTAKSGKSKDISKIIPSIITILHERPQTISSLADELDVDQNTCMMIVKNLEKENAIIEDDNTEWPEPLYKLDEDGYKKYVERANSKAKPKATSKASEKAPEAQKAEDNKEYPSKAEGADSTVEKIVVNLLSKEDAKISALVKKTDTAITRIDIEKAIESLMDKGVVACDNPSKRYPIYSLSDKDAVASEPSKSTTGTSTEKEDGVKKSAVTKSDKKPVEQKQASAKKEPVEEKAVNNESFDSDLSPYSDIAALQLVLEDVLPTLSPSKARQVQKAIAGIEKEKDKVKNAVSNLNKTINELM